MWSGRRTIEGRAGNSWGFLESIPEPFTWVAFLTKLAVANGIGIACRLGSHTVGEQGQVYFDALFHSPTRWYPARVAGSNVRESALLVALEKWRELLRQC